MNNQPATSPAPFTRFARFGERARQTSHVWLLAFTGIAAVRALLALALAWIAIDGGASRAVGAPAFLAVLAGAIAVPTLGAAARGRCPRWLSVVAGVLLAVLMLAEFAAALVVLAVTVGPTWLTGTWLATLLLVQAPVTAVAWWPAAVGVRAGARGA